MIVLPLHLICKFQKEYRWFSHLYVHLFSYDISNDGQVDQKELANLISSMVSLCLFKRKEFVFFCLQYDLVGETDRKGDRDPKKKAAEIIAKLDVSGDKKLTKAEFIAG